MLKGFYITAIIFVGVFVLAVVVSAEPAFAQQAQQARFRYSLWASEMSAKLEVPGGTTFGTEFSLNDLAMDKKDNVEVWEMEMWQGNLRLDVSHWYHKWDGYAQINRDISYEGNTYDAGDIVDSGFKMRATDVAITTYAARSFKAMWGIVGGIKYIEYYSKLWNITKGFEIKDKAVAPIPYLGISLELLAGEQTIVGGRFVMSQYSYSGTDVSVTNFYQADAFIEFKAGTSLALRIGFHNMVIDYENKTPGDGFKIWQLMKGTYAALYLSF